LGQKQGIPDQNRWEEIRRRARELVPDIERRIDQAAAAIRTIARDRGLAYGWSGGKDSVVLGRLCDLAGYPSCILVITALEYRAFLQWVTDNMPEQLTIIRTHHDLGWLSRNPDMLFPRNAAIAARWFHQVQHWGQEVYVKREGNPILAVGRRRKDGNFCGGPGGTYTSRGVTRYAPMADWTHEEVFAALDYFGAELPPCYNWPRGYQVGTGPWAARQFAPSIQEAWREVHQIDANIVREAAAYLPSAQEFLCAA
jgi:3'-phosphoadenosine 5'-phosphosulfate sulfotransferase (PAPS reductase)/FAD synthetase